MIARVPDVVVKEMPVGAVLRGCDINDRIAMRSYTIVGDITPTPVVGLSTIHHASKRASMVSKLLKCERCLN